MRILLIRHAEPEYSVDSLTPKGRVEAELLSRRLIHCDVKDFYVSPLGRAKETAAYTLEKLGLDYIDLVLLHQPFSDYYGAYRALEDLYDEGLIKAIGVSNFYPDRLTDICLFERKVIPAINQVEVNPFNAQFLAQANMEKNGVQMEAWAPFAEGKNDIFNNDALVKIAEKNNKTSA